MLLARRIGGFSRPTRSAVALSDKEVAASSEDLIAKIYENPPELAYSGGLIFLFMPIFHTQSAEELRNLGAGFAQRIRSGVVALSGELGAGKTTFVQGALAGMGAGGPFTSPTFVLMKQYDLPVSLNGIERVYHVDAYRVGEEDLCAQGFAEWANDPAGVVLLEWPERVPGLVPEKAIHVSITVEKERRRVEILDRG